MRPDRRAARIGCGVCLLAALVWLPAPALRAQQNQPDGTKADVMFVLDITGSMRVEIEGVEKGLEKILNKLKANGIDARVGLTVFRDAKNTRPAAANDKVAGIT